MARVLPRLMGILNVTPDSFSDGGRWAETDAAIARGRQLLADGADIVDVGGESTRPGATRPLVSEELDRVLPVIGELAAEGALVSVDTMRAEVARAALDAGARIVNDVSGGLADPDMLEVVAGAGVSYVAMHWRAHGDRMQQLASYETSGGVVATVCAELGARVEAMLTAGIDEGRIVLDPGLGFAKTAQHNWELLRSLDRLRALDFPLLVGASRKAFLGAVVAGQGEAERPVGEREYAGVALSVLLARQGLWGLRVHDVRAHRDALRVLAAMEETS